MLQCDTPSPQLRKEVRAVLVQRGTPLIAFCKGNCMYREAVTAALSGTRPGPRSRLLAREFLGRIGVK